MQVLAACNNCLISDLAQVTYFVMFACHAPYGHFIAPSHPASECLPIFPFCMNNSKQSGLQYMVRQCTWMHPCVTEVMPAIASHQGRGPKPAARKWHVQIKQPADANSDGLQAFAPAPQGVASASCDLLVAGPATHPRYPCGKPSRTQ